jgi:hypothetical protein
MVVSEKLSESDLKAKLFQVRSALCEQRYYRDDLRFVEAYDECFRKKYLVGLIFRLSTGIDPSAKQSLEGRMVALSLD